MEFLLPKSYPIVYAEPVALLNTSPKINEGANTFIQFVLSLEGQKIWLEESINRLPSRDEVFLTMEGLARKDLINNFQIIKNSFSSNFNVSKANTLNQITLNYFQSTITDSHLNLRNNWGKIANAYFTYNFNTTTLSDWIYSFGYPAILEFDAIKLNSQASNQILLDQWNQLMNDQYIKITTLGVANNFEPPKKSPVDYFIDYSNNSSELISSGNKIPYIDNFTNLSTFTITIISIPLVCIYSIPLLIIIRKMRK